MEKAVHRRYRELVDNGWEKDAAMLEAIGDAERASKASPPTTGDELDARLVEGVEGAKGGKPQPSGPLQRSPLQRSQESCDAEAEQSEREHREQAQ